MREPREPVRVAVNVMRARLTVVGFNLAIITYQLNAIPRLPGAVPLPELGISVHLATDITLLLGLALSIMAMVSFIVSVSFDEQGTCNHWSLLAGDLLMYLGMAQSVAGFFRPFMGVLDAIEPRALGPPEAFVAVHAAAVIGGGAAWLAATYVGPVVALLRSPFGRPATLALALAYLVLLVAIAQVGVQATRFEVAHRDGDAAAVPLLGEFLQPCLLYTSRCV